MWSSRSFHMRSFLAAALFLAMLIVGCSVLSVTADEADADTYGDYTYTVSDGKVTITGYSGSGGNITIPSNINGCDVTAIGDYAFTGHGTLREVTIPDTVTSIGKNAFSNCYYTDYVTYTGITKVIMGSEVTTIGEGAFYNNYTLTTIDFTNSNKLITIGVEILGSSCYIRLNLPMVGVSTR